MLSCHIIYPYQICVENQAREYMGGVILLVEEDEYIVLVWYIL